MADVVEMTDVSFRWASDNAFGLRIERFSLPSRSRTLLLGPSGSGKSTLLSLLCGIVRQDSGMIRILDQDLAAMNSGARDRFRAEHFGIIFQMFNLLPYATVRDNILLPLHFARHRRARVVAAGGAGVEVARLLTMLGLDGARHAEAPAHTLSVGQQQRVAAARALIGRPEIIVADEPTSALDRNRQAAFLELLFGEVAAAGATLVMVSHDESLAKNFDAVLRIDAFAEVLGAGATP